MVSPLFCHTLLPKSESAICTGSLTCHCSFQPAGSRMVYKITVLGDGGVGKTALTVQVGLARSASWWSRDTDIDQFTMSSFVEVSLGWGYRHRVKLNTKPMPVIRSDNRGLLSKTMGGR